MSKPLIDESSAVADFGTSVHKHSRVIDTFRRWTLLARAIPFGNGNTGWKSLFRGVESGQGLRAISISKLGFAVVLLCGLGWLMRFSLYLAASRIYQVDECMETYVASVLATTPDKALAGHATLFQVLLSILLPHATQATDLLASGRLIMTVLFWLNCLLLATATDVRVLSLRWLAVLAGAATLAPLWDYGFEIRHDNLMLTVLLLIWVLIRNGSQSRWTYFAVGALSAALEFIAFKGFVYVLPISAFGIMFLSSGTRRKKLQLALVWLGGAVVTFIIIRISFEVAGIWKLYLGCFEGLSEVSTGGRRFGPGLALGRLLSQTPLLLALTTSAMITGATKVMRRGKIADSMDFLPEAGLFLISLAALLINPTPYPYNLINLVPFAFLFVVRYYTKVPDCFGSGRPVFSLVATVLVFTHLIPFWIATRRHLNWTNVRQEGLISLAEDLTRPEHDPVYDAIGMIPTRPIVSTHAFLQSLDFKSFVTGGGPQIRDMLAANPAAVIIPSYRTDWLPEADHEFIRAHYVELADDFWVLGSTIPTGSGKFEIVHEGRYRISALSASDLDGTYPEGLKGLIASTNEAVLHGTIDGVPLSNRPVELNSGSHYLESDSNEPVAVAWVGPRRDRLPRIGHGNHRTLFVNWY